MTSELAPWLELADQTEATRAESVREVERQRPHTTNDFFDMVGTAILANEPERLRRLVTQGFVDATGRPVNATDSNGRTLLWWACSLGRCDCASSLLAAGANPKIGPSALAVCSNTMCENAKGGVACAKLLLEAGVPIEPELMVSLCDCDDYLPLIEILSSHGAPR